jgi:ABC-2 type transport system permease protein
MNILYLLQLELLKMRHYMPFRILMGLYVVLLPLSVMSFKNMPFPKEFGLDAYFMFPNVWQTLAYAGNWVAYFALGFINILNITNEYSLKTLRQNIISGISRTDFYLSKVYFMGALCLAATVYYIFLVCLFGFINTETLYVSRIFENSDYFFRYFLMCFSFSSMGFLFGMVFRKSGISLFLYFAYTLFIERIIRYLVLEKIVGSKFIGYMPANATNDLTPFPIPKGVKSLAGDSALKIFLSPTEALFTTIIFTILFLYLAYWALKNRDL